MSAIEYNLPFNSLARYPPAMVMNMKDRVYRFVSGLGPHLMDKCLTAALQDGMDISRIQAHANREVSMSIIGVIIRELDLQVRLVSSKVAVF